MASDEASPDCNRDLSPVETLASGSPLRRLLRQTVKAIASHSPVRTFFNPYTLVTFILTIWSQPLSTSEFEAHSCIGQPHVFPVIATLMPSHLLVCLQKRGKWFLSVDVRRNVPLKAVFVGYQLQSEIPPPLRKNETNSRKKEDLERIDWGVAGSISGSTLWFKISEWG